jgi:hypothetical protein
MDKKQLSVKVAHLLETTELNQRFFSLLETKCRETNALWSKVNIDLVLAV